jgi:hypothetical protein
VKSATRAAPSRPLRVATWGWHRGCHGGEKRGRIGGTRTRESREGSPSSTGRSRLGKKLASCAALSLGRHAITTCTTRHYGHEHGAVVHVLTVSPFGSTSHVHALQPSPTGHVSPTKHSSSPMHAW